MTFWIYNLNAGFLRMAFSFIHLQPDNRTISALAHPRSQYNKTTPHRRRVEKVAIPR